MLDSFPRFLEYVFRLTWNAHIVITWEKKSVNIVQKALGMYVPTSWFQREQ